MTGHNLCQLDAVGLSCMGCCGHEFGTKKAMIEGIDKNSMEFVDFIDPDDDSMIDLKGFKDRHPKGIMRSSGICYNLIWQDKEKGRIICPLHPEFMGYEGEDLRVSHCNPEYLCKTAFMFSSWDDVKQERFVAFVKGKGFDWYSYSIGIESGSILDEFESREDL